MNQRELGMRRSRVTAALPERIVQLIARAPYAHLVVRSEADRLLVLPEIISLHTRQELLEIEGVGMATVRELEAWLAQYRKRLRKPDENLDAVICNLGFRSDWMKRFGKGSIGHNANVDAQMPAATPSGLTPSPGWMAATSGEQAPRRSEGHLSDVRQQDHHPFGAHGPEPRTSPSQSFT